jgi:putative transcription factor|tara:strand:+ start:1952 stop:2272 length:321 start_codon:yes stop_codon:yes gene_type:complete
LKQGLNVTAVRKDVSNVNKAGPGRNASKLENETEELTHKTVKTEVKKAIMQGRLAKKLTQAQLAQQINERPQVVQEYESGKAIPNQQILAKLERVLGVKLRGKGMR